MRNYKILAKEYGKIDVIKRISDNVNIHVGDRYKTNNEEKIKTICQMFEINDEIFIHDSNDKLHEGEYLFEDSYPDCRITDITLVDNKLI